MKLKQFFCDHDWESQMVQLTNISIRYTACFPVEETRTYTVRYACEKCGKSEIKERYIERGITDEERDLLVKESSRYAEKVGL